MATNRNTKRKDKARVVLRKGESQRKDGKYDFRWTSPDGKRHSIYAATLEELREKENDIQRDSLEGIKAEARYVTLNDVFTLWAKVKRGLKDNTFQNYLYLYRQFVEPDFGKSKVSALKKSDVKQFPAAIFIGSDGIDDSYSSEMELHELYRNIFIVFAEHSTEVGNNEVRDYLPKITRRGSGDDVSIAGIIRTDLSEGSVAKIRLCGEEIRLKAQLEKAERTHRSAIEKRNYIENNMKRNRTELQKLTERLLDAEAGLKASEVALYKAQAEWKSLQARLNALERDTLGNVAIQAENVVVPDSDAKDLISIQDAAKSEVMQETQGISH